MSIMSHSSSTLKRYTDTGYSKSYGGLGSYTSNLSSSYSDRNKLPYKSNLSSSYYTSSYLHSYPVLDRSIPRLDPPSKRTDILARSPSKCTTNPIYSYGHNSTYSTLSTTPVTSLSRKKSSSHTDLSLGLSELRTSDTYYPHSPALTRSRLEANATSRFSRSSNHSEFSDIYGKKRGSSNGYGNTCVPAPEPLASLSKPTSRFPYSHEKSEGSSCKEELVRGLSKNRNGTDPRTGSAPYSKLCYSGACSAYPCPGVELSWGVNVTAVTTEVGMGRLQSRHMIRTVPVITPSPDLG